MLRHEALFLEISLSIAYNYFFLTGHTRTVPPLRTNDGILIQLDYMTHTALIKEILQLQRMKTEQLLVSVNA